MSGSGKMNNISHFLMFREFNAFKSYFIYSYFNMKHIDVDNYCLNYFRTIKADFTLNTR